MGNRYNVYIKGVVMHVKKSIFWFILILLAVVMSGCISHPSRPSHHMPHHLKNDVKNPTIEVTYINMEIFEA